MSCESRHRAIITDLLTLAGLHDTDADTVMGVGVAKRRRRGGLPTPDAAATVPLHADAQLTLDITGHSDQAAPAWVAALIDLLHTAAERGNRRAFLTLRLLTEGWDAITPYLTDDDRRWFLTAKRVGIPMPQAWEAWLTTSSPAGIVGRLLPRLARGAIVLTETLDALHGIDGVPPAVVQAVTPLQVLRFLSGQPLTSYAERQQVLRAVLENTPVVRETITWLNGIGVRRADSLLTALIGRAARARRRSVEEVGRDGVLKKLTEWIRHAGGSVIEPSILRDPSPAVVETIFHLLRDLRNVPLYKASLIVTALMHVWQRDGRDDVVAQVVRTLALTIGDHRDGYFAAWATAAAITAGAVRPPHGDVLVPHLVAIDADGDYTTDTHWSALVGSVIYAVLCQSIEHVPIVAGMEHGIHHWRKMDRFRLSYIPMLTVGRERELLLPAIHTERDDDRRRRMLLDIIDAMDLIDAVGGDPQAFLSVIADAVTGGSGSLDPQLVIRLAASRCGQALLVSLPPTATPPVWTDEDGRWLGSRLIPHLVSPWWATAPPHLHDWWEHQIGHIDTSHIGRGLNDIPPLYPTVSPRAGVHHSIWELVARVVAHSGWATIPDEDRRACLSSGIAGKLISTPLSEVILHLLVRAATPTAVLDIRTAVETAWPGWFRSSVQREELLRVIDTVLAHLS